MLPHKKFIPVALENIKPHDHLCFLYDSVQEWQEVIASFFAAGLNMQAKCLYITDYPTAGKIKRELYAAGIDAISGQDREQIEFMTARDVFNRFGAFVPQQMVYFLKSETQKAQAQGFSSLFITVEMSWALNGYPGSEKFLEYEAILNRDFFPHYPCAAICQYSRKNFSSREIKEIIKAHPLITFKGHTCKNFYYLPGEKILAPDREEKELREMLLNLERDAQEEQQASFFREVIKRCPQPMLAYTPAGGFLAANEPFCALTGYSAAELKNMNLERDITPMELHKNDRQAIRQLLGGEASIKYEKEYMRKDGKRIPVQVMLHQSLNSWGDAGTYYAFVTPIGEQKKIRRENSEREKLMQLIAERSGTVFFSLHLKPNFSLKELSSTVENLTGYSVQEFFSHPQLIYSIIHPEDRVLLDKFRDISQEEERSVVLRMQKKDGKTVHVQVKYSITCQQEEVIVQGTAQDITDRLRTEEVLKFRLELQALLMEMGQNIAEAAPEAIDDVVKRKLESLGKFARAERAYIVIFNDEEMNMAWEWHREGIGPICFELQDIPRADYAWLSKEIERGERVFICSSSKGSAKGDQEKTVGSENILAVPLFLHNSVLGFLGLELPAGQEKWQGEYEKIMNYLGRMFMSALKRRVAHMKIERLEELRKKMAAVHKKGLWSVDKHGKTLFASRKIERMLGYEPGEMLGLELGKLLPAREEKLFNSYMERLKAGSREQHDFEFITRRGHRLPASVEGYYQDDSGEIMVTVIPAPESDEKESVEYRVVRDRLTGLYRHEFFQDELERLEREGIVPLGIILISVNGLEQMEKIAGKAEKDKLLVKVAELIKNACGDKDIAFFMGGHEFVIIRPQASQEAIKNLANKLGKECRNTGKLPVPLSISTGSAVKMNEAENLQEIYKKAEQKMLINKILQEKGARGMVLAYLEKHHKAHSETLQELARATGEKLGIYPSQVEILSQLALLHDLGKVAIPEEILEKPGTLNREEWNIIRRHPELGYRIAKCCGELEPVAEGILAHHEWWDGSGYPQGLQGEEIPLKARIIAVVDAYDVMVHGRPYQEPVNQKRAIAELHRWAGIQFDPGVVTVFTEKVLTV